MKKLIFFVVIIGLLFLAYQNKTVATKVNQYLYASPCDTPKNFRIGNIDPRFDITQSELISDAEQAASAWKNNQGMILLKYVPNAAMPINMVYDQRQALDTQINTLNNQVSQQKNTLKPEVSEYDQKVTAFKQQSEELNSQIQYWNSKGGAPQDIYSKLVAQQQSLQQQATQLQQMATQLNQSTDQYNANIQQLNQKVNSFNTVLSSTPEEGVFIQNGASEVINIYITNSQQELIHTLAHEMGHSLGLGHNSNPNSIMYPYTNTITTPSVDDEKALSIVCQKQSIFQLDGEKLALIIASFRQELIQKFNL